MERARFRCPRCGGPKRVVVLRGPWRVAFSAALLVGLAVAAWARWPAQWLPLAVVLAAGLAFSPALTLLRVRCLRCEPRWTERIRAGRGTRGPGAAATEAEHRD